MAVLLAELGDDELRVLDDVAVALEPERVGGERLRAGIEDQAVLGRARDDGGEDAQRAVLERADPDRGLEAVAADVVVWRRQKIPSGPGQSAALARLCGPESGHHLFQSHQ